MISWRPWHCYCQGPGLFYHCVMLDLLSDHSPVLITSRPSLDSPLQPPSTIVFGESTCTPITTTYTEQCHLTLWSLSPLRLMWTSWLVKDVVMSAMDKHTYLVPETNQRYQLPEEVLVAIRERCQLRRTSQQTRDSAIKPRLNAQSDLVKQLLLCLLYTSRCV